MIDWILLRPSGTEFFGRDTARERERKGERRKVRDRERVKKGSKREGGERQSERGEKTTDRYRKIHGERERVERVEREEIMNERNK